MRAVIFYPRGFKPDLAASNVAEKSGFNLYGVIMIDVLIYGAKGRMGKKVKEALSRSQKATAMCGVDIAQDFSDKDFPIYKSLEDVKGKPQVIIDFSNPSSLPFILEYCKANNIGAVLCSTGYSDKEKDMIAAAAKQVALFRSANMSLGVNVLIRLVKQAAASLNGFDIEIVEMHHNQKKDAPSGTAIMLADGIKDVLPQKFCTYGREGIVGKRNPDEIGVHAVRGGSIVGEHEVIFAGENERICLSHSAQDRGVFAEGAVKAAEFLCGKPSGIYDMNDLLCEENA